MTEEQREKVLLMLESVDIGCSSEVAIADIDVITTPQWLPVADLVRDSRDVVAAGWKTNPRYFKTAIVRADAVQCWPEFTHYVELPAESPEPEEQPDGR